MLERGREAQDEEDRVGMRSVEKKNKRKQEGRKSEIQQREEQKSRREEKRDRDGRRKYRGGVKKKEKRKTGRVRK